MTEKMVVVFDLDGTISNVEHRLGFLDESPPNWDAFYSACDHDIPHSWAAFLARTIYLCGAVNVVIVSARRDTELEKTKKWLADWSIPYHEIFLLRKGNSHRPDVDLKMEWVRSFGKSRIIFVVDDRQKVVDAWRREWITCLQCYAWKERA